MATVVNNPPASNSGTGMVVATLLLLLSFFFLLYYGLPALRSATARPNVSIPREVDVNVNGDMSTDNEADTSSQ